MMRYFDKLQIEPESNSWTSKSSLDNSRLVFPQGGQLHG